MEIPGKTSVLVENMKWSKYQKAIFKFTKEGKGHGIIEAVAGEIFAFN